MGSVSLGIALMGTITSTMAGPAVSRAAEPAGGWRKTSPMRIPRAHHTATLLDDGSVLMAGGCSAYIERICSKPTGLAELYNPRAGTWAKTASMNTPRFRHAAALLPGGRVLVVGGCSRQAQGDLSEKADGPNQCSRGATAEAEIYDPKTRKWSETGEMSRRRANPLAVSVPVKSAPGCGENCRSVAVVGDPPLEPGPFEAEPPAELYDPQRGTWAQTGKTPLGLQPEVQNALLLGDGNVLFAGPASWFYSPADGSFTPTAQAQPVPHPISSAAVLKDGRVLLVGATSAQLFDPFTAPDPARPRDKGKWDPLPAPAGRRNVHAAVLLSTGEALLAGGGLDPESVPGAVAAPQGSSLEQMWSAELFNPVSRKWRPAGRMVTAHAEALIQMRSRPQFSSTLLSDGRVLIAGGVGSTPAKRARLPDQKALRAAEIYTPEGITAPLPRPASGGVQAPAPLLASVVVLLTGALFVRRMIRRRRTHAVEEANSMRKAGGPDGQVVLRPEIRTVAIPSATASSAAASRLRKGTVCRTQGE